VLAIATAAGADDPFRVSGRPPESVVVTLPQTPTSDAEPVPMLGRLRGVLGVVDPPALVGLRRGLGRVLDPAETAEAVPIGMVHLSRDADHARLELLELPGGLRAVRQVGPGDGQAWLLRPAALDACAIEWWQAGWTPQPAKPGERIALAGNATPAPTTLDALTTRRIFRANYPRLTRDLASETLHIRLPDPFDPSVPAGVLVWISPVADGRLPPLYERALDELGFIAVGADNAGNERELTDRYQLMLDAIESARRRFLIDDERVYVSGMSGGGRSAAILQCTMPDLFAGAVPIVGLDSYHDAPTGRGTTRWPARFGKPIPAVFQVLETRRIAAITGDMDFNEPEMRIRTDLMKQDGIDIRLDTVPGMAHTLADAARFRDALRWVDEPRREQIQRGGAEAMALLAKVPPGPTTNPAVRAALIEVIRAGPWSDAAWAAAERLGHSRERFVSPSP
jgi:dienelactone hydrolase